MNEAKKSFEALLDAKGLEITDTMLSQFELYYRTLVEWNEKMNLTAITDRDEVFMKHFYDSLSLSFHQPMEKIESIADIGSGAGFPSIPLKICFPHLRVTIIDSLNKRILFLEHLVKSIGLEQVAAVHGRAEDLGHQADYRESYDLVTARAVARLNVLSEFCLPFTKVGGTFIAMKGSQGSEELVEAKNAIQLLGGKIEEAYSFELPLSNGERTIIRIKKIKNTSKKYPRKPGIPLKQPIL